MVKKVGKKKVPYAGPIHFGWGRRNIHPQPFLYEALDKRRDEVLDAFALNVQKLADSIAAEASKGGAD